VAELEPDEPSEGEPVGEVARVYSAISVAASIVGAGPVDGTCDSRL
jgi:hypothetical protein